MLAREPSVSGDVATTATAAATVTVAAREAQSEGGEASGAAAAGIFGSSNSGEDDKTRVLDGGFGGNRWPRQETLALLKIRSEMDIAFRDSSVKGPLWDEVSRKLGELGYNRSAKKCKEKFENVFKYHKRTKDGRISKGQGKTYRFFDQLEAFHHHHHHHHHQSPSPKPQPPVAAAAAAAVSIAMPAGTTHPITTVPSTSTPTTTTTHITSTTIPSFPSSTNPTNYPSQSNIPPSFHNISTDPLSNSTSSSSTSSDLELEGGRGKRKRKWKEFFERMMKEVVDKQEELQKKFLEAIEKREHERRVREEAWRMQEMTRINREREILSQERSISATKDAAVMAFLQKLADQQNAGTGSGRVILPQPAPTPTPIQSQPPPPPQPQPKPLSSESAPPQPVFSMEIVKKYNGSSSRWPKVEVEALISVRKNLETKYQENGPKGALWEEISAGMRRLGYNRSSKRCKEKWENINKYFKKVKESNKKRPEDSKTCPYFHQLDALYREKNSRVHDNSASNQLLFKPENSVPLMVRPEQQWPPPQPGEGMEDVESDQNVEEDDKDGDEEEEEEEEEDVGIVPNKQVNSMNAND